MITKAIYPFWYISHYQKGGKIYVGYGDTFEEAIADCYREVTK